MYRLNNLLMGFDRVGLMIILLFYDMNVILHNGFIHDSESVPCELVFSIPFMTNLRFIYTRNGSKM